MIQQQVGWRCYRVCLTLFFCLMSSFSYGSDSRSSDMQMPGGEGDDVLKVSFLMEGGFGAGTVVETIGGPVAIEDIRCGDVVKSCDQESNTCVERKVETIFSYMTSELVKLNIGQNDAAEALLVTSDHRFFDAREQTWRRAADLQEGDELLDSDFMRVSVKRTELVHNKKTLVYNFSVEDMHNYYAGKTRVLVHNFNPLGWLSEKVFHSGLTNATFLAGLGSLASLMVVKAPYGRHISEGWGKTIPNKLGWIIMELPSVVTFASTFFMGEHSGELAPKVLAGMWLTHYIYRTFIYPSLINTKDKEMPLSLALTGAAFNTVNSYINARALSQFSEYPEGWLKDPRFLVGAVMFALGMTANVQSDQILINLRKPGETGYKIPNGGLFKYVSCPNYLGEMVEWLGWSIASWSKSGAAFAFYTAANLVPRALANHKWYQEKFGEAYPAERAAVIPGVL